MTRILVTTLGIVEGTGVRAANSVGKPGEGGSFIPIVAMIGRAVSEAAYVVLALAVPVVVDQAVVEA